MSGLDYVREESMGTDEEDLRATIVRHKREIDELQAHVKTLEGGYTKEKVEAEIRRRMEALEVEVKFQELQETMAEEEAPQTQLLPPALMPSRRPAPSRSIAKPSVDERRAS
jgi:hypothetical protein